MVNEKSIPAKKLNVTVFRLEDNQSLWIGKDKLKEKLWEIFQISLQQPILIHCASGVGRTGHFILMLEILKHYDKIFVGNNVKQAADAINKIIDNMRSVRPALINTKSQLEDAIQNAVTMHDYALAKNYNISDVQNQTSNLKYE